MSVQNSGNAGGKQSLILDSSWTAQCCQPSFWNSSLRNSSTSLPAGLSSGLADFSKALSCHTHKSDFKFRRCTAGTPAADMLTVCRSTVCSQQHLLEDLACHAIYQIASDVCQRQVKVNYRDWQPICPRRAPKGTVRASARLLTQQTQKRGEQKCALEGASVSALASKALSVQQSILLLCGICPSLQLQEGRLESIRRCLPGRCLQPTQGHQYPFLWSCAP